VHGELERFTGFESVFGFWLCWLLLTECWDEEQMNKGDGRPELK
jgi:hypothetical protein